MTTARRDTILWLLCVTPAVLLTLHGTAILPLLWSSKVLTTPQLSSGFAYATPLRTTWMSREITGDSPAQLTEDGHQLGPANAPMREIEGEGYGRFALSGGILYFSASDNSDPASNGRRYVLHWPTPPGLARARAIMTLALVSTLALIVRYRARVAALIVSPPFWLAATIFLVVAVVSRLWYFTDFPVPGIAGDSSSYYVLVQAMDAGHWPEFGVRPPGYPVFMKLVFAVSDRVMSLVIAQSLLTLAACLALIYAIHLYRRWLALWSALAMGVFVSGLWVLDTDTSMLSDGPYSNAILLAMAFLIIGLVRRTAGPLLAASTMMATAILFRPAGMFLFVIYGLCLAFLLRNGFGRRPLIAFAIPLPALMLALCLYNFFTIRAFAMSEFGEVNLAMATFTFWEQDPGYAPEVNAGIARAQAVMREQMTDEDRELLRQSWEFRRLTPVFLKGFHWPAMYAASGVNGWSDYRGSRAWIRRVCFDSIKKHPDLYAKFVLTQLWLQYVNNINYQDDFILSLRNRVADMYTLDKYTPGKGLAFYVDIAKEYALPPFTPAFSVVGQGADAKITMHETSVSRRLFRYVNYVRRVVFGHVYWVWAYVAALILSSARLITSRFRHTGAFISFVLTISLFGASLVVALVEYGGYRYSYVMEYVYYLPILLLPFLDLPRAPQTVPDGALLESVVHNLKNNRGPGGNEPVGFFPADDESADLVARMRGCGAIRKDDVLLTNGEPAASHGVRSLYLLRTSAAIERQLAEVDPRHDAFSVNDVGVVSYPVGDEVIGRQYRTSYLEYAAGVVPPLHYSNYAYIQYLKTIVRGGMSVLDGFAGPGTVGLSLAVECHLERIAFFEYSPAATRMLRSNAARNLPATTRVDIYEGDLFATVPAGEQFDLIVGNPPHNLDLDGRYQNLERVLHIQSFDPALEIHKRFFAEALPHLRPGGRICLLENGERGCILHEHLATLLEGVAEYTLEPPLTMAGSQFYVATIRRT